jgi:hypothetical protein
MQTYADAVRWQSRATFVSDDDGQVDVTRRAPVSGTYEGVAPMGFFWSMDLVPGEMQPVPPGAIMLPVPIRLEAEGADGRRAEITIVRRVAGPGVTRHVIRTDGIVGTLFLPPGPGPHSAVMVVSGGGGGLDEFRGAILASHGYAALALGHFAVEGRPRGLVNIPLEYFETAIGWMRAQTWFDSRLLAVWGASRGGELALLLGATFPEINAVAAWVPSGVVFWALGMAEPGDTRPRAAWTFRGRAIPYLQENNTSGDPPPAHPPGRAVAYRHSTAASCATRARSSARPYRSRRSAGRCSWSRASTIRCGRRPTSPTSRCAGSRRTAIRSRSAISNIPKPGTRSWCRTGRFPGCASSRSRASRACRAICSSRAAQRRPMPRPAWTRGATC